MFIIFSNGAFLQQILEFFAESIRKSFCICLMKYKDVVTDDQMIAIRAFKHFAQ